VGYRLDFTQGFSPLMLTAFLLGSSVIVLLSIGLAARLAGFRGLDIVNLAMTAMPAAARASSRPAWPSTPASSTRRSSPAFVVTAVLTSQACGVWLDFVLRKGWPLLASEGRVQPRKLTLAPHRRSQLSAALTSTVLR
jgi:predicted permease